MSSPAAASLSTEQITAIVQRREAALLEKFIHGKTNAAEQAEIAHLIAQLPPRPGATPAAPAPAASQAFALDAATPETQRRTGLRHELSVYAECYGKNERTIKRWIATGKAAVPPDPCPLDDPRGMPGWWQRNMHQTPPDVIHGIAKGHGVPARLAGGRTGAENAPAENFAPANIPKAENAPPAAGTTVEPTAAQLDILAQVEGLRRMLAEAKRRFDEAIRGDDENVVSIRQRNYERTFDLLRKSEQTLTDIQKDRGLLVPKADVEHDLGFLVQQLAFIGQTRATRLCEEMPDLSEAQKGRLRAAVINLCAEEAALFRGSAKWSANLPPAVPSHVPVENGNPA